MRLLTFTFLAIAISVGVQLGMDALPLFHAMRGFGAAFFFLSPVIVTIGLAFAMRISNLGYVIFLVIFSPFVSWILGFLIAVFVFDKQAYI